MRIAHVDTGREWRGGQSQVLLLLAGLAARGHDVLLAAPDAPLAARGRTIGIEWMPLERLGELDPGAPAQLARRLGAWHPELLHAHTAHAHTLARGAGAALGVPVVVSRRVLAPVGRNPLSHRKYARGVARYLCISRAVMEVMQRCGIDPARLALVPSSVDVEALDAIRQRVARAEVRTSLRALIGAAPEAPVVGAVGALTPEKGIDVFAAAVSEVLAVRSDAHAVWIGDGPERGRLERALARNGLERRARVLGVRDDANELMAQLTLLVSTSRHEGLGTVVLEAQALGVPVISTDSLGVRDAIEDGVNGRIVEAARLGRTVLDALSEPEPHERWRREGLATVVGFDAGAMVERTLEEYAKVIGETSGARSD